MEPSPLNAFVGAAELQLACCIDVVDDDNNDDILDKSLIRRYDQLQKKHHPEDS